MKIYVTPLRLWMVVFFLSLATLVSAESNATAIDAIDKPVPAAQFKPIFPRALTQVGAIELAEFGPVGLVTVPTKEEMVERDRGAMKLQSVFLNNDVFALYGKPGSNTMGILGQYPLEDIEPIMDEYIKKYDGRFPVLHIKDEKELGVSGKMDFKPIFEAAYSKGLKEYYVEVEQYTSNDPFASVKQSFDYLAKAEYVK